MLSLRKLLLDHLHINGKGKRACNHCQQDFSPNSDSSTWGGHFELKHNALFTEMENEVRAARLQRQNAMELDSVASATPAAAAPISISSISSRSSSSSRPPQPAAKKAKHAHTPQQPTIQSLFSVAGSKAALASLARFVTHSSIAHNVVETPEFREFLGDVGWRGAQPTRQSLKESILTQSAALREKVAAKFAGAVVSIAADGWTNVRHEKVSNVVVILDGRAFYWRSVINAADKNTAQWQAEQLLPILHALISEHNARIVAYVVDNEAVNRATFERLRLELPFLVHVPCAAHTLQLIVRSCLNNAAFSTTVQQLSDLIRFFDAKENRLALRRIHEARELVPLTVLKPNDTRWSSTLIAAERILRMRKEVETCYDEDTLPSVDHTFFPALSALCVFLKPFQVATDVIQSDAATLYTVYEQFVMLQQHVREKAAWAESEIKKRWNKQVNIPATVASAILSFAHPPASLDIQAAQRFIVTFGSDYLHFYDKRNTRQQFKDTLTLQLADFNGRAGVFDSLEDNKGSVERASGGWNPRRVWLLYGELELGKVALALLSISASEAAVERTFSAQTAVHTKKRNRLHGTTVEAEMFLKFNARVLQAEPPAVPFGSCREITDDDACLFMEEVLEEEEEQDEEEEEKEEFEVIAVTDAEEEEDEDAAAAPRPSAAERRAARRAPSISFADEPSFIRWFKAEMKITAATVWNGDLRNELQRHSSKLVKPRTTKQLEDSIRASLAAAAGSRN